MNKIKLTTDPDTFKMLIACCCLYHQDVLEQMPSDLAERANALCAYEFALSKAGKVRGDNGEVKFSVTPAEASVLIVVMFLYPNDHPLWLNLGISLTEAVDRYMITTAAAVKNSWQKKMIQA